MSGGADPAHGAGAMAAVDEYLVRNEDGLVLLFTPPFDKTPLDPGYIKGYPPGIRENGGQYTQLTHSANCHRGCADFSGRTSGGDADYRRRAAGCRGVGLQWQI
jgi:Glycosyl hydrolase 36 superfamily, catalytic domain